jgi:hypothetical protein
MSPESVFRDNSRPLGELNVDVERMNGALGIAFLTAIARYAAIHRAELTRIKRRSDVVDVSDEGFF